MSSNHDEQRTGLNWFQLRKLRTKILVQQGFKCLSCAKDVIIHSLPIELHHIDGNPKNNKRENLEVLCEECHGNKHPEIFHFITKIPKSERCPICNRRTKNSTVELCSSCQYDHFGRKF